MRFTKSHTLVPPCIAQAILAGLIALLGHNGKITWALVGTVAAYLGLDIMLLHKWRSDPGPREPTE